MTTLEGFLPRPRAERSREAVITAAAFVLFLLGSVVRGDESLTAPPIAAYLLAVVSCAALPLRHRTPLPVMVVTTLCSVLAMVAGLMLTPLVVVPAMITAYTIAVRTERRTTAAVLLISAALLMAAGLVLQPLSWSTVTRTCSTVIFPLAAGVLGHSAQNRRAYLAAVEERALRAEESRESEALTRGRGTGAHRPGTARPRGPRDHPCQRTGHGRRALLRQPPRAGPHQPAAAGGDDTPGAGRAACHGRAAARVGGPCPARRTGARVGSAAHAHRVVPPCGPHGIGARGGAAWGHCRRAWTSPPTGSSRRR